MVYRPKFSKITPESDELKTLIEKSKVREQITSQYIFNVPVFYKISRWELKDQSQFGYKSQMREVESSPVEL